MAVHDAKLHSDTEKLNPDIRIAIVAAEFNKGIMTDLIRLNINKLQEAGFVHVDLFRVPGAFEMPAQTSVVLESGLYSVVITL